MHRFLVNLCLVSLTQSLLAVSTAAAQDSFGNRTNRFVVLRENEVVEKATRLAWGVGGPQLDGKAVFETPDLIWVMDTSTRQLAPTVPRIEFWNGDVLPGELVAIATPTKGMDRFVPHLLVRATHSTPWPNASLRILPGTIRRIIMQEKHRDFEAGTVWTRTGTKLRFRAHRWSRDQLQLLTENGRKTYSLREIEELHIPGKTASTYRNQLPELIESSRTRLLRVETNQGGRLLASTARIEMTETEQGWLQGIQPVWSLDTLWIPANEIRLWHFSRCDALPLTDLFPRVTQRSSLGAPANPIGLNRSEFGTPLRTSQRRFGWGFGTHSYSSLEFEIPDHSVRLATAAALDHRVGRRGCVRLRISTMDRAGAATVRAESSYLTGSDPPFLAGGVPLANSSRVRLEVLTGHEGRPAGADPLDIRDSLNWLEPTIHLSKEAIDDHLRQPHLPLRMPVLGKWELKSTAPIWRSHHDQAISERGTFRWGICSPKAELVLQQSVSKTAKELVVLASHHRPQDPAPQIKIHLNGKPASQWQTSVFAPGHKEVRPRVVSIPSTEQKETVVQIIVSASETPIVFHQLEVR